MLQPTLAVSTAIILSVSLLSPQLPNNETPEHTLSHLSLADDHRTSDIDNSPSDSNPESPVTPPSHGSSPDKLLADSKPEHQDSVTSPGVSVGVKMESDNSRKILQNFRLPNCRITQDEDSHNTKEGGHSFALDIACVQGVSFDVRAPDFKEFYVVAYIGHDARLGDYIVLRHGDERWIFGHTQTSRKTGERIEPGYVIGQTNLSGHTEGMHVHIEYWKNYINQTIVGEKRNNQYSRNLCDQREWKFCDVYKDIAPKKVVQANTTKSTVPAKKSKVTCRADMAQDMVQYAYDLGGIDFVGTISAESKFDPHAVGDSGSSYGYCQIHRTWNAGTQDEYRKLTTNKERMDFCFRIYKGYVEAGNIQNRLYGYRVRYTKGLPKLNIKCQ